MKKWHLYAYFVVFFIQLHAIGNVNSIIDEIEVTHDSSFGGTSCSRRKLYVTRIVRLYHVWFAI